MDVPYELTVDGYELHWQINYLAPFVLTSRVTPLMLASAAQSQTLHRVRVVNVSSDLAFRIGPKKIQFDDVNMPDPIGMMPTR